MTSTEIFEKNSSYFRWLKLKLKLTDVSIGPLFAHHWNNPLPKKIMIITADQNLDQYDSGIRKQFKFVVFKMGWGCLTFRRIPGKRIQWKRSHLTDKIISAPLSFWRYHFGG